MKTFIVLFAVKPVNLPFKCLRKLLLYVLIVNVTCCTIVVLFTTVLDVTHIIAHISAT